jgi:F0F1-type ATP synthase assembly protein I
VQLAMTAGIASICAAVWSAEHAWSALAGGAIGTAANLPMALALFRTGGSPKWALGRMVLGQLTKIIFTVAMIFWAARMPWMRWLPLLVAYAATFFVFWWVPYSAARRAVKVGG